MNSLCRILCLTLILSLTVVASAKEPTIIILGQSGVTSNAQTSNSNDESPNIASDPSRSGSTPQPSTITLSPLSSLTSSLNLLRHRFGERKKNNNNNKDGPRIIYISSPTPSTFQQNQESSNINSNPPVATSPSMNSPISFIPSQSVGHHQSMPANQIISRSYPVYQPHHQISGPLIPNYQMTPYPATSSYPNHYSDYDEYPWSGWR